MNKFKLIVGCGQQHQVVSIGRKKKMQREAIGPVFRKERVLAEYNNSMI